MKATRTIATSVVILLLTASIPSLGSGESSQFVHTHYYLLSLGETEGDLQTLTQIAQTDGFSVILYDGNDVTAYRGTEMSTETVEELLTHNRLLVIDSNRFYLRVAGEAFTYTVRPAEDGYELVVNPHEDQTVASALASVLTELQEWRLLGIEVDLAFRTFAKDDVKGPAPPIGVAIDSTLYALVVAEDWFAYSASKGLSQVGLRLEVVAEKVNGEVMAEVLQQYVTSETDQLAKLLLPIDELIPLAESTGVGYVRPPYRPAVP